MSNEQIVPSEFDSRPGVLQREIRDTRLRIEALEQAIRDADESMQDEEGVGLTHLMNGDLRDSIEVINEVLGEDEG